MQEATTSSPANLEKALRFAGVAPPMIKRNTEFVARLPALKLSLGAYNAVSFSLNITRLNPARMQNGGVRIFAPRYPKPQTEGFFLVLSYTSTDEIIALKRVNWADPTRSGPGGRGRGGRGGQKQIAASGAGAGADAERRNRDAVGGGARLHASARMSLPPETQGKKVDVSVYSDSYIGMKWSIEGVDIPLAPVVDDGGKKKEGGAGVWDDDNL